MDLKEILWYYAVVVFAQIGLTYGGFEQCAIKMEPIGCYNERSTNRALPQMILTGRDPSNSMYEGPSIDWGNYDEWLGNFTCRCADLAFERGFNIIGIHYWAECWAAKEVPDSYDQYGISNNCYNQFYQSCQPSDNLCTGPGLSNFVYRIAPSSCNQFFEPVGCYGDDGAVPRLFSDYAFTERDFTMANSNGFLINWRQWNTYSLEMICRCAQQARRRMHDYFALQFYGECWTGCENSTRYYEQGHRSTCIAKDFDSPNPNSYGAVGQELTNYIYRMIPPPIFVDENLELENIN